MIEAYKLKENQIRYKKPRLDIVEEVVNEVLKGVNKKEIAIL